MRIHTIAVALLACSSTNAMPISSQDFTNLNTDSSQSVAGSDSRTDALPLPGSIVQLMNETGADTKQLDKRAFWVPVIEVGLPVAVTALIAGIVGYMERLGNELAGSSNKDKDM